jgi:outer membrane receptor for ferrienterochelin and colicins
MRRTVAAALLSACTAATATELPAVTALAPLEQDANSQWYDRAALEQFGDSGDIRDALRRLPGVQINPDGRVQLRGMGNGYTRIEINGVAVGGLGAGATLEGFNVDTVESVEIVRGTSASASGEAVAGILRITTRSANGRDLLRLKTQLGSDAGRPSAALGLEWSGKTGAVDYQFSVGGSQRRASPSTQASGEGISMDGSRYSTSQTATSRNNQTGGTALVPQIVWHASPYDSLTLGSMVETNSVHLNTAERFDQQAAWPAWYATIDEQTRVQFWGARPQLQWKHRWDNGDRLVFGMGGIREHEQGRYARQYQNADGYEVAAYAKQWDTLNSGHHLDLRWDVAANPGLRWALGARVETETQRETDTTGGAAGAETAHSRVQRRQSAAFVQAKATLATDWRLETGLRHERTQLDVADDATTRNTDSGIWLPSATLLWDMTEQRRLRLNAGRTYRSPRLKDLSPSTILTSQNAAGNPDTRGNPLLQPERATGIELGLEQALGADDAVGAIGITLLQRRIRQHIQYQLVNTAGRWLLAPVNAGDARMQGLELDGRWELAHTAAALPVTLRSNLGLYTSRLEGAESPNGLVGQPSAVMNLGFDVRSRRWPLTWGGNFNASPGYSVRVSEQQTLDIRATRSLDLYAQWAFDPKTRLRLSAARLGGGRNASVSHLVTDAAGNGQRDTVQQKLAWSAAVSLEKTF